MKVLERSFVRFVCPFLFDAQRYTERVNQVQTASYPAGAGPAGIWRQQTIDPTGLLPYVARYLNSADAAATARIWEMDENALQSPNCLGAGETRNVTWHFVGPKDRETRFRIESVQLLLFRVGVGFLTVRIAPEIEPDAAGDNLAPWLDFLHFFRYWRRPRTVHVRAERREFDPASRTSSQQPFFPSLAGGPAQNPDQPKLFFDVVEGLLRTGARPEETGPWWREVFISGQALPYAALFVEGVSLDQERRLLYKVHNFFQAGEGEHPAASELEFDQPHLVPYADRQWFVCSLDGGAFVACDPPNTTFFNETLPQHLDAHYLLVYLLALHQRFALMGLTEDVSQHWLGPLDANLADDQEREQVFRRIRDTLLSFTARGYFAQVMQRRHHHRCYQKWQEVFQVERLFREVSDEVREMHDYLQMRKTAQLQKLAEEQQQQSLKMQKWMDAIAAFLVFPLLILSFLEAGGNGVIEAEGGKKALFTSICMLIGFALGAAFMWYLYRPSKKGPRPGE